MYAFKYKTLYTQVLHPENGMSVENLSVFERKRRRKKIDASLTYNFDQFYILIKLKKKNERKIKKYQNEKHIGT